MRLFFKPCLAALLLLPAGVFASGPLGLYSVIEKVVMEPNDTAPERIQVWGAFAYYDSNQSVTVAKRGYMYFRLPDGPETEQMLVRREWADLKAVAGTGQTIAFGRWGFIGTLEGLQSDSRTTGRSGPPYIISEEPGRPQSDVRVRPPSEPVKSPAVYQTNAGIVKVSAEGSHAAIVKQLKDALAK